MQFFSTTSRPAFYASTCYAGLRVSIEVRHVTGRVRFSSRTCGPTAGCCTDSPRRHRMYPHKYPERRCGSCSSGSRRCRHAISTSGLSHRACQLCRLRVRCGRASGLSCLWEWFMVHCTWPWFRILGRRLATDWERVPRRSVHRCDTWTSLLTTPR